MSILLLSLFTASCDSAGSKQELLVAVKTNESKTTKLIIYEDYHYEILTDDSVFQVGNAKITGKKIVLIADKNRITDTRIYSAEFIISGDSLCANTSFEDTSTFNYFENDDIRGHDLIGTQNNAFDKDYRECYSIIE